MPFEEAVWFVPFDADTRTLQSVYGADAASADAPATIGPGRPFTISLDVVKLANASQQPWYDRVLSGDHDVLVLSSAALGAKPLVERVHYYKTNVILGQPLLAHDLLSDVIWICDDYRDPDPFYVELQVVTINRADEQREAALKAFETFAGAAGAIFPVALPYVSLGEGLLAGFNTLWAAVEQRVTYRLVEPMRLFPPRTPRKKTIRAGQFVITSERIDGTQYKLADDDELLTADGREPTAEGGAPLSYAVLRLDPVLQVPIDFVVSQRVATLLTQLKNDQEGQPAGLLETSFGFLTDTLKAYTNFTDLQRYQELLMKGDGRAPGETEQLQRLAQRPELQPFLPKPTS